SPVGITTGPDGDLWFAESNTNKIGRLMPDGTHLTEFTVPTANEHPTQITTGPDGNLWFIEATTITGSSPEIGQLNPATGKIMEFPVPRISSSSSLTFGPDGNLWFTEPGALQNMIGRITPDGSQLIELPIPTPDSSPRGITSGPDGNLWFAEAGS